MNIIYLDEIDSTNAYARRNLKDLPDGTVICARAQTAGHGQFGRRWEDLGEGNLFVSIVLKPDKLPADLTLRTAQILCKVLADYGVSASVKAPNDVLVDGKKIAGILAETVTRGEKSGGIGRNRYARGKIRRHSAWCRR